MCVRRKGCSSMLVLVGKPAWWRGDKPADAPVRDPCPTTPVLTGNVRAFPAGERGPQGLRKLFFFKASVTDAQLWLNDVHLVVEWSEFANCHFQQRVKPIINEQGF